jgi:hypothetical protein
MKVQGLEEIAFSGGRIVITQGANALRGQGLNVHELLQRHFLGDDGDVTANDHARNMEARLTYAIGEREGGEGEFERVFSSYQTPFGKVWIITEADRSYTTVLLPTEY